LLRKDCVLKDNQWVNIEIDKDLDIEDLFDDVELVEEASTKKYENFNNEEE